MAIAVVADILEHPPTIREERGTTTELTRHFLVSGLPNTNGDHRALSEALGASGVPTYGDEAPGDSNLLCADRSAEPVTGSPSAAYVHCKYMQRGGLVFLPNGGITWAGGGGLSQVETQNDVHGVPITVTYTYPSAANYKNNDVRPELADGTYTKGATIRPSWPEPVISPSFELSTFDPTYLQMSMMGFVNKYYWAGGGPRQWLCQGMDWEQIENDGSSIPRFRFRGSFQRRFQGWDEQVWYTDDVDDSVPNNLTTNESAPNSVWTPEHYYATDFGYYFPV